VSFDRLRAEGGFIVSAERRGGRTIGYRIEATVDGVLRWIDPFTGVERREFLAAGRAVQATASP
jgi:hypothetical protein